MGEGEKEILKGAVICHLFGVLGGDFLEGFFFYVSQMFR